MRWQSPERGLIPPMEFISYAEESGLIVPLGRWVMLDVVRRSKMARQGINMRVAVNVSARQLADQTIFSDLKQALKDLNFEYCPIDVELTESCLIENEELALSVIQQFSRRERKFIWMTLVRGTLPCRNWRASLSMPLSLTSLSCGISISSPFHSRWCVR